VSFKSHLPAPIDGYSLRIKDEVCLSLLQCTEGSSSSTSGAVTAGSGTTPEHPIVYGPASPGPMEVDTPRQGMDIDSPVPPPYSPTMPAHSPESSPIVPDIAPLPGNRGRFV
jgi:hypothetical protein